jgi:hypothetical protein
MYRRPPSFAILRVTAIVYSHKNYYKALCIAVQVRRSFTVALPSARAEKYTRGRMCPLV